MPTQAAETGWPVERLVDDVNAVALVELDAARAELAALMKRWLKPST